MDYYEVQISLLFKETAELRRQLQEVRDQVRELRQLIKPEPVGAHDGGLGEEPPWDY